MTEYRCRRGTDCSEADILDGPPVGAAIVTSTGLCTTDTHQVAVALEDMPRTYTDLQVHLPATRRATPATRVAGTRALHVPIRLDVEALQRRIHHVLVTWAEILDDLLGLQLQWPSRSGAQVQLAADTLARHLVTLLRLPAQVVTRWQPSGERWEVVDMDGADAGLAILDNHRDARRATGRTRLVHRLPSPCPRCERQALERADGTETITCAGCGHTLSWDEYEQLCLLLVGGGDAA